MHFDFNFKLLGLKVGYFDINLSHLIAIIDQSFPSYTSI